VINESDSGVSIIKALSVTGTIDAESGVSSPLLKTDEIDSGASVFAFYDATGTVAGLTPFAISSLAKKQLLSLDGRGQMSLYSTEHFSGYSLKRPDGTYAGYMRQSTGGDWRGQIGLVGNASSTELILSGEATDDNSIPGSLGIGTAAGAPNANCKLDVQGLGSFTSGISVDGVDLSGVTLSGVTAIVITANIFNPDDVVSGVSDNIAIWHVDADKYPNGIILDSIWTQQFGATAYAVNVEEWDTADNPSVASTIELMTIGVGTFVEEIRGANIDDRNIAAGGWIFLDPPTTETDQLFVKIKGRIK